MNERPCCDCDRTEFVSNEIGRFLISKREGELFVGRPEQEPHTLIWRCVRCEKPSQPGLTLGLDAVVGVHSASPQTPEAPE